MILNGVNNKQIAHSYQFSKTQNTNSNGATGDRVELANGSADSQSYILMPPKNEGLFKTEPLSRIAQVETVGGEVKEELKLVGGYLASLSDKQAAQLEKQGWKVVPDEIDNFLPPIPGEEGGDTDGGEVGQADAKPEKPAEKFVPRPAMTAPRYSDPLLDKFQGEGISVAIIDTGIYPHPDFNTPYNRIVAFKDFVNGRTVPYDDNGHGTHCAGDAAGSGLMSDGIHKGLASKANLVGIKVLGANGSGKTSDIIKGIQWCIEHKDELNLRVINLSLGHKAKKAYEDDPTDQAVKAAYDAGLVVVAAAGNDGPDRKTVGAPGDSPWALTVGAADDKNTVDPSDDKVTDFSSRGPTPGGLQKPDVIAPGEAIWAPLAPGTDKEANGHRNELLHESLKFWAEQPFEVIQGVPKQQFQLMGISGGTIAKLKASAESSENEFNRLLRSTSRTPISDDGAYQALPGTSMATPITAGLAVSMLEANPDLTPEQVKSIIISTADKLPGKNGPNKQGAGMIDPHEALMVALHTEGQRKPAAEAVVPAEAGPVEAAPAPTETPAEPAKA